MFYVIRSLKGQDSVPKIVYNDEDPKKALEIAVLLANTFNDDVLEKPNRDAVTVVNGKEKRVFVKDFRVTHCWEVVEYEPADVALM